MLLEAPARSQVMNLDHKDGRFQLNQFCLPRYLAGLSTLMYLPAVSCYPHSA